MSSPGSATAVHHLSFFPAVPIITIFLPLSLSVVWRHVSFGLSLFLFLRSGWVQWSAVLWWPLKVAHPELNYGLQFVWLPRRQKSFVISPQSLIRNHRPHFPKQQQTNKQTKTKNKRRGGELRGLHESKLLATSHIQGQKKRPCELCREHVIRPIVEDGTYSCYLIQQLLLYLIPHKLRDT